MSKFDLMSGYPSAKPSLTNTLPLSGPRKLEAQLVCFVL